MTHRSLSWQDRLKEHETFDVLIQRGGDKSDHIDVANLGTSRLFSRRIIAILSDSSTGKHSGHLSSVLLPTSFPPSRPLAFRCRWGERGACFEGRYIAGRVPDQRGSHLLPFSILYHFILVNFIDSIFSLNMPTRFTIRLYVFTSWLHADPLFLMISPLLTNDRRIALTSFTLTPTPSSRTSKEMAKWKSP